MILALSLWTAMQAGPLTRAEATNYKETSTYADVVKFLDELKASGAPIDIRWSGTSAEGRKIPMVIAARPMVHTPAEAAKSGKLVIYIQANIHAGEVEGKEAALALLRKYSREPKGMLDKTILIVQPIYNCDGNEKFGPQARNRPGQNGPELVGLRPNGQNLDLNRDCTKVESPEMTGVLKEIYPWNPHAMFDLHTTDGTRHGYHLTYAGPLNPNTHPLIQKYELDEFLPAIRNSMRAKYKRELFDYGNAVTNNGKWQFETFGGEPRYVTNYAGMRNTLSILSESVVYETFEDRVKDTAEFVDECLLKMVADSKRIKDMRKRADADVVAWGKNPEKAPQLVTRYDMKSRGEEPVLLEKNLAAGGRRSGPVRDIESIKMPVLDRFAGTKFGRLPYAYVLPFSATRIVGKLRLHGITVQQLDEFSTIPNTEGFTISKVDQARSAFQGHKLLSFEGEWKPVSNVKQGFVVFTAQPLGILAFELLEPECIDGLAAWGMFGEDFKAGDVHPVLRVFKPTKLNLLRN